MAAITALHPCEARGQEDVGGPVVECSAVGRRRCLPRGEYFICDAHAEALNLSDEVPGS